MTPTRDPSASDRGLASRRVADDALLAELTAPPDLHQAQESLSYWQ